jgi:pimeloyl-ACP methyl ester carboxylesterase
MGLNNKMTARFAIANGVKIAFRVQGEGPPLVLVMGYRLNSAAWPAAFIEGLARRFSVITLDNRGTGQSDKPVDGYAIANMARDVAGVLDELKIARTHMMGYSMGGAIAQEFVRQFPERIFGLVLCATMCGGPRAIYAPPAVIRVMRELDGLKPEEIARQIWQVTYAPGYLAKHQELAEDQMRREIAAPTPLHAADLQFQAFAEFDCSKMLPNIQTPTLVLTGDLDQLVSPQNSRIIASLIPDAKLIMIPGCGHRVMWEATDECIAFVSEFLSDVDGGRFERFAMPAGRNDQHLMADLADFLTPATELFMKWPWMLAWAGVDAMTIARQSIYFGGRAQFGDGKPVVLLPEFGTTLLFAQLANWLKVLGYRPLIAGIPVNSDLQSIANSIRVVAQRVGRKVVLVVAVAELPLASRIIETCKSWVSDIVVLNASHHPDIPSGIRAHFISSGWSLFFAMAVLPQVLRNIRIELIEPAVVDAPEGSGAARQASAEGEMQ